MRRSALALLLGCLLLVAGASALDGYDYYQTIEYAGCDQEVYQQDIIIHRSAGTAYNETSGGLETWHIYVGGHCREDYGDIRFTNSTGAELAYYLWPDYDSSSARFCVRLEGADAAGTLAIWYGNPTATTTSDGDAAYLFFDTFDGDALNSNKWTDSGNSGEVTVTNGEAVLRAAAASGDCYNRYITSKSSFSGLGNISVEIKARVNLNGANRYGSSVAAGRSDRSHYGTGVYGASHRFSYSDSKYWFADGTSLASSVTATNNVVYRFDIYQSGTRADYYADGVRAYQGKTITFSSFPYIELYISTWDAGNNPKLHVDYVCVRAYSATPPAAITFSGERETASPPSIRPRASATIPTLSTDLKDDLIDSLGGETVPEPGEDTINWTGLVSTIGGAYTSVLGPLAYTLIFSIPFLMMWITQRDMTLPGLVGALFGLFIIVRLPAEFHLVAVTFIVISIVAVIYSLVKERV